LIELKPS